MKHHNLIGICLVVLTIAGGMWLSNNRNSGKQDYTNTPVIPKTETQPQPTSDDTVSFDKSKFSVTDPTSIWVVVNKKHSLNPLRFKPTDLVVPSVTLRVPGNESMQLRKVTSDALEQLFAAAKTQEIKLVLSSGYRSYSYQNNLYNGYVSAQGQAVADTQSARPGFSEHQTGLAVDIRPASGKCDLQECFADTPEGKWLVANSFKYGFILRYTADNEDVTGYKFEPWHFRYVGTELATEFQDKGVKTLEEFFGITGGTSY